MLRDCFDLCLAGCICKCVYVSGLYPTEAGGGNDVRLLPTNTLTHTYTHTLSLCRSVLSGVSPTRFYRAWNSLIISGGFTVLLADTSACTHAKTPTHARMQEHSAVDWLDYTSREAQPDRGTSTKKETRKEYKRLICPCCISMFHLPTLAYPHPHRLDPIASARPLYLATQTSPCEGILQSSSFS